MSRTEAIKILEERQKWLSCKVEETKPHPKMHRYLAEMSALRLAVKALTVFHPYEGGNH